MKLYIQMKFININFANIYKENYIEKSELFVFIHVRYLYIL